MSAPNGMAKVLAVADKGERNRDNPLRRPLPRLRKRKLCVCNVFPSRILLEIHIDVLTHRPSGSTPPKWNSRHHEWCR